MAQLTLIARAVSKPAPALPEGFSVRALRPDDAEPLGRLYYDAHAGLVHADVREAINEVCQAFAGEFGELWPEASGLVVHERQIVAAIFTVSRAPWADTPDCPFITDLFTDQRFRRQGLARALMARCLVAASSISRPEVALRVESDNKPAVRLYEAQGFRPVS